jgi:hypothetical protein
MRGRQRRAKQALAASSMLVALSIFSSSALAISAPKVYTGEALDVTHSSAVLRGGVNPQGQATNYVFQYGPTRSYVGQTAVVGIGNGTSSIRVSQAIGGLAPNTTYHFRIVANSVAGVSAGADHTFKTPKVPLSLQIFGSPNPVPFGATFAVQGTLVGTGAAGRVVELQFNPFPYLAGFKRLGNSEVTSSTGGFLFPVVGLPVNTQLRVVTTGAPFVSSPVLFEGVAVRVRLHVRRVHRHRPGRFYRFYGSVAPAEVGAQVGFQLLRHDRPSINVGGTVVRSGTPTVSRFSKVVHIRHRGVYQALVKVSDGSHVSAYSQRIRIR